MKFFPSGSASIEDDEEEYIYYKVKKNKKKDIAYTKGVEKVESDEISKHLQLQRSWRNYLIFTSILTIFLFIGCLIFGGYTIMFRKPFLYMSQIRINSLGGQGRPMNTSLGTVMLFGCENPNLISLEITKLNFEVFIVTQNIKYPLPEMINGFYNITNINMKANQLTEFKASKLFQLGDNYSRIRQLYFTMNFAVEIVGKIEYKILFIPYQEQIKFYQNIYNYKK